MQAGLLDKTWTFFDSGACANCCPEWFTPEYPVLLLNESASLGKARRSLHQVWRWKMVVCILSVQVFSRALHR